MISPIKLAPWVATIGLFLVWELACRLFAIPEFVLPAPSQAIAALVALGALVFGDRRKADDMSFAGRRGSADRHGLFGTVRSTDVARPGITRGAGLSG